MKPAADRSQAKKSLRGGVLEITLTTFGFRLNVLNYT
jgi:hypothetical protein